MSFIRNAAARSLAAMTLVTVSFATVAQAQVNDQGQGGSMMGGGWHFGWILWIGFIFLMFSVFGNWGYTYQAHRKYDQRPRKQALDILDERYARGEVTREQYGVLKADISSTSK